MLFRSRNNRVQLVIGYVNSLSLEKLVDNYKRELLIREYSAKTISIYSRELRRFLQYASQTPEQERGERIRNWLAGFESHEPARRLAFAALKFFYYEVVHVPVDVFRMRRRSYRPLPEVLSRQEVGALLDTVLNRKHRLMLALMYGSGLRVGELVALNTGHIDFSSGRIHVCRGKGAKDRYVVLSRNLYKELLWIIGDRKGNEPLFVTRHGGRYTTRTLQLIFQRAKENAHIIKKVSCHTLRHSFATHMLERGTDIRVIQSQLGHKNLKTTMSYTHITDNLLNGLKSPLDD